MKSRLFRSYFESAIKNNILFCIIYNITHTGNTVIYSNFHTIFMDNRSTERTVDNLNRDYRRVSKSVQYGVINPRFKIGVNALRMHIYTHLFKGCYSAYLFSYFISPELGLIGRIFRTSTRRLVVAFSLFREYCVLRSC